MEKRYRLDILDTPKKKNDFIGYIIQDYLNKDSHANQRGLTDRCFDLIIDQSKDYFNNTIDEWRKINNKLMLQKTRNTYKKAKKLLTQVAMQLIEEQPIHYCNNIIQTIQEAKQKSIEYNKPSFIKITFFEHSFLLSLFDNKVCLIDSLNSQTGSIFKMLLKIINKKEKLDLTIININTDQQTDFNSCPYFTGFNITRLDKWFQTNFKNFDKLFKKNIYHYLLLIPYNQFKKYKKNLI